jgi:haloalkane dehalogenase
VTALSGNYRVIVPDHIGCGASDKPLEYEYRLAQHIKNVETLIDHLGISKLSLGVHDWGGAIGMGFAIGRPQNIRSLVIFNTAAFLSKEMPFTIELCRIPKLGEFIVRGLNGFVGPAVTLGMGTAKLDRFTDEIKRGYLGPYDTYDHRVAVARFVQDIPLNPSHPSYATLENIQEGLAQFAQTPTLMVWGMRDFVFTESFMRRFMGYLKNVEAHRLDDCGHFVVEDAHERIIPWLTAFLERTQG